jgi:long-chain acyl-CoA synthetase
MFKTEGNLAQECRHFAKALELGCGDVFLGVAPFCHAFGAISFLASFHAGARLVVLPVFLPGTVLGVARKESPTVFLATPPMIELLGRCRLEPGDEAAFRGLRFCICSTGHLSKSARDTFVKRYGKPVYVQYGSTETLSATLDLGEDFEEGCVGRPYDGVEIGIFREDGTPCLSGERGLVGIRSPAASLVYLGDPASTARTFRNGFVFPGDAGRLDAHGRLHLLGRSDILNVGGYKVDCLKVEEVILNSLPVAAVVVLAGERAGLPIVRAVVEAEPGRVTGVMVREACRSRLSPHEVPSLVEVLSRLPRDGNGKLQRTLLAENFCQGGEADER